MNSIGVHSNSYRWLIIIAGVMWKSRNDHAGSSEANTGKCFKWEREGGREGKREGGEVIVFLLTGLSNGATTSVQHIELQLVDSKKDIESPPPFHSTNNHNPLDD